MKLFFLFALHKNKSITTAPLSILMVLGYLIFLQKFAHVLLSWISKKNWRTQYSYLLSCSCLGIIMNLHLYEDKYFPNYLLNKTKIECMGLTQWSFSPKADSFEIIFLHPGKILLWINPMDISAPWVDSLDIIALN